MRGLILYHGVRRIQGDNVFKETSTVRFIFITIVEWNFNGYPTSPHPPLSAPGFAAKCVSGVSYTVAPVTSSLPTYSKILFSRKSRKAVNWVNEDQKALRDVIVPSLRQDSSVSWPGFQPRPQLLGSARFPYKIRLKHWHFNMGNYFSTWI